MLPCQLRHGRRKNELGRGLRPRFVLPHDRASASFPSVDISILLTSVCVCVCVCEKLCRGSRRGITPDKTKCVSWTRARASRRRSRTVWDKNSEGFPSPLLPSLSQSRAAGTSFAPTGRSCSKLAWSPRSYVQYCTVTLILHFPLWSSPRSA